MPINFPASSIHPSSLREEKGESYLAPFSNRLLSGLLIPRPVQIGFVISG